MRIPTSLAWAWPISAPAFPVPLLSAGSPTKTQMVDGAGGRTQLSLIVTAVIVLMVLLFLTGPLAYMPDAVLSAVVFLIGVDLIDFKGMRSIYEQRRSEFWVAVITMLVVALVGVEQGIILAVVLSLIDHTRRGYQPKNAVLVPEASGVMRAQPVASKAEAEPGLLIYRFTHSMYYANAQQLTRRDNRACKYGRTAVALVVYRCLGGR